MTPAVGRVVDSAGKPLAGVEIQCRMKTERFSGSTSLWSDNNGQFRFFGIPSGKTVSLVARTIATPPQAAEPLAIGTLRPVSLQLSDESQPELILESIPTAYFAGTVLERSGSLLLTLTWLCARQSYPRRKPPAEWTDPRSRCFAMTS
ncbi:MAG: carboxypeptidase-like regulatory domain-containing protein [Pirellulaceae bacterium]